MKQKRHPTEEIIRILREADSDHGVGRRSSMRRAHHFFWGDGFQDPVFEASDSASTFFNSLFSRSSSLSLRASLRSI